MTQARGATALLLVAGIGTGAAVAQNGIVIDSNDFGQAPGTQTETSISVHGSAVAGLTFRACIDASMLNVGNPIVPPGLNGVSCFISNNLTGCPASATEVIYCNGNSASGVPFSLPQVIRVPIGIAAGAANAEHAIAFDQTAGQLQLRNASLNALPATFLSGQLKVVAAADAAVRAGTLDFDFGGAGKTYSLGNLTNDEPYFGSRSITVKVFGLSGNRTLLVKEVYVGPSNDDVAISVVRLLGNGLADPSYGTQGEFLITNINGSGKLHAADAALMSDGSVLVLGDVQFSVSTVPPTTRREMFVSKISAAGQFSAGFGRAGSGTQIFTRSSSASPQYDVAGAITLIPDVSETYAVIAGGVQESESAAKDLAVIIVEAGAGNLCMPEWCGSEVVSFGSSWRYLRRTLTGGVSADVADVVALTGPGGEQKFRVLQKRAPADPSGAFDSLIFGTTVQIDDDMKQLAPDTAISPSGGRRFYFDSNPTFRHSTGIRMNIQYPLPGQNQRPKLLVVGNSTRSDGTDPLVGVLRFTENAADDPDFNGGAAFLVSPVDFSSSEQLIAGDVLAAPDGSILVGGTRTIVTPGNTESDVVVARIRSDDPMASAEYDPYFGSTDALRLGRQSYDHQLGGASGSQHNSLASMSLSASGTEVLLGGTAILSTFPNNRFVASVQRFTLRSDLFSDGFED